jgi:hypothetical protein
MKPVTEYIPGQSDPAREWNNPTLDTLQFMEAVMHDTRLPIAVRLDAADKLARYRYPMPKPISARDAALNRALEIKQ